MHLLPIRLAMATAALSLFASFTKFKTRTKESAPARQESYYWYTYPGDSYNDENTLANEEYEMWIYYDAPVNTSPSNGTLIERGYYNNVYPHEFAATYFLYVHEPSKIAPRLLPAAPTSIPGFVPVGDFPSAHLLE